jgi:hypothetical protein
VVSLFFAVSPGIISERAVKSRRNPEPRAIRRAKSSKTSAVPPLFFCFLCLLNSRNVKVRMTLP